MRLFAGIPPSVEATERLASLRLRMSAPRDGLRWSAPEQWHITLQFYGEVSDERADCLRRALANIEAEPAEILLEGFGRFAAKGILHAAVWLSPSLSDLQQKVLDTSKGCGVLPESRPFHPHVTMARSRGKAGNATLKRFGTPLASSFGAPLRWLAQDFVLYQSILRPQGAEYLALERFPLKATKPAEKEI